MKIERNFSLKNLNTFGIEVFAQEYIKVTSFETLKHVVQEYKSKPIFILSGGSNMLLTKNIEALVIHLALKGIEVQQAEENTVLVSVNAGENWHEFVLYCIENNYGGLENLSLIPGYVGSAPIQNIGAYGVELKDTFVSCEALHMETGKTITLNHSDCKFGYRSSIFKNEAKGKYIITQVTFKLTTSNHTLNKSYGAIEKELNDQNIASPSIKDVSNAVIKIRQSKLPDPKKIGNSGSFFKNPVISKTSFIKILENHPNAPHYTIDEDHIKVPAGWLIEQCGFKGKRWGDAGVHKNQALVLVNYGDATGAELLTLSQNIQKEVFDQFGIQLESEVNII